MIDVRAIAAQATVANLIFAPPHAIFWLGLGSAIFLALTGYLLQKLSRLFYVYEFNHADHHWEL